MRILDYMNDFYKWFYETQIDRDWIYDPPWWSVFLFIIGIMLIEGAFLIFLNNLLT